MRVGSPSLDNTHSQSRPSGITSGLLPLGDDPDATARVLWQLTDREYEQASGAFLRVKTNQAVRSEEEDKSPDFSQDQPETHLDEATPASCRRSESMGRARPKGFRGIPEIPRGLQFHRHPGIQRESFLSDDQRGHSPGAAVCDQPIDHSGGDAR